MPHHAPSSDVAVEERLQFDVGSADDDKELREYDVTYYGPIFGLNLHWGGR